MFVYKGVELTSKPPNMVIKKHELVKQLEWQRGADGKHLFGLQAYRAVVQSFQERDYLHQPHFVKDFSLFDDSVLCFMHIWLLKKDRNKCTSVSHIRKRPSAFHLPILLIFLC